MALIQVSGLPVIQTRGSGQEDVTIQSAQGANYPVFRPMSRSLLRRRFAIILKSVYRACGLVLVSVQESIPFSRRGYDGDLSAERWKMYYIGLGHSLERIPRFAPGC